MKTALILGSTGLIGKQLLELLLLDSYYTTVKAVTRRPLNIQHPKLSNIVINFETLTEHYSQFQADDVFCCLGTTIKQAGTKQAFQNVDFEYPLETAKISKSLGASQYLLVSALGANKDSSIFYNQVKGKLEDALQSLNYDTLHIFRPSLLLGNRTEQRTGEDTAKIFYKLFGFLIPKKYKAIESDRVARAMLVHAKAQKKGFFLHESAEMQHF